MDELAARLECHRDLRRDCVHIDMDAYFAAVEMRDDPSLRTVPMAVGSSSMLSTSNYLARRFGVRAAMPGFIAKKLCPQLRLVPGNYSKYTRKAVSLRSRFLLRGWTRIFRWGSRRYGGECICWLPLMTEEDCPPSATESCKKCGKERKVYEDEVEFGISRAEVVREIRFRVEQATGLTCSAGIAPNFATGKKFAQIWNKPNEKVNIDKECFLRVALGLPGRPSSSDPRRKSISTERTFTSTSNREALVEIMEDVCDMLIKDMKRAGIVGGRCVTLKLKLSSFDVLTRSETPGRLVSSREEILSITREVLDRELPNEFRLLGIRLSHLQFEDDRPSGAPISVLDFWKRQQLADSNCTTSDQPSSSVTSEPPCSSDEKVPCPICGCLLKNDDREVNRHVDECLNAAMLLEEDPQMKSEPKPPKKRKATIENFLVKRERK
ncbi:ImpB/MucB/SamB family protein [Ostertagia ostertagi]